MATAGQLVKRNWFCGVLLIALVVGAGSLAEEDGARKKRDEAVEALRDVGGVFTFAKELSKAPVELTFTGHRLSDLHLVQLRALPSLRVLDFNANQNVTDMGYLFLQSLPELRTLNLGGTRITNAGLVNLKKLKKLETLHLWLTTISDEGLLHLTKLPNLKMLKLWDAHISDDGLKHLAKMKSLRRLCIGRSLDRPVNLPIDDPVAMNLITDEGVRNLQKALPDTKIFLWNAAGKPLAKGDADPRIESKPKPAANVPKRQEVAVRDIGSRPGVDWPSFLGPTSNSKSSEKGILTRWPKAGPKIVWQKLIGDSHSAPAISKGRLFFFDRVDDTARVTCLKSETGELLWTFETPTDYIDQIGYGNGP
ncbi:MAG: hypothetical protein IH991_10970, partial [Planctomycetes bacterium]|nr:hypothetical protein [Planctomycetota bacterium]